MIYRRCRPTPGSAWTHCSRPLPLFFGRVFVAGGYRSRQRQGVAPLVVLRGLPHNAHQKAVAHLRGVFGQGHVQGDTEGGQGRANTELRYNVKCESVVRRSAG